MARKSRKNIESDLPQVVKQTLYDVGAYVRLSAVDRKQKGDSIETQQTIISAFIAEHADLELRETYIDNGLSGQSFERPAFQKMLEDLESGKINCCVTKDLSRLGRNAIDTGYYIEKYFPTRNIRFIAINDDYDSADSNSGGIIVSLKNMVNEAYALEIGRKIRATKQMNIRNGCYVGRIPPYGYLKSRENGHKLVIDEYAAPIVRRVFEMAANGNCIREILDWINGAEILPPKRYFHSIGLATEKEANGNIHWNKGMLYSFLHNRIYCGDMVQGKGKTRSYVCERLPQSEWIITENTHEGIVSRELFAEVQELWSGDKQNQPTKSRYNTPATENIFLRKVFCGHCGYTMRRARTGENQYNFKCETRYYYGKDDCTPVSINENELREELLEILRKKASVFADIQKLNELTTKSNASYNTELRSVHAELDRNGNFLKGLYESLISGDIDNDDYRELKKSYETKIALLSEKEKILRENARERNLQNAVRSKTADSLNSIQSMCYLTAETVDRLIDKILVFEDKRIDVHFKFKDEMEDCHLACAELLAHDATGGEDCA